MLPPTDASRTQRLFTLKHQMCPLASCASSRGQLCRCDAQGDAGIEEARPVDVERDAVLSRDRGDLRGVGRRQRLVHRSLRQHEQ